MRRAAWAVALLAAGCAPAPLAEVSPAPAGTSSAGPSPSASPATVEPADAATTSTPSPASPAPGGASSGIDAGTSASPAEWRAVDLEVRERAEVESLGLHESLAAYLASRLQEPCELSFKLFAAHSDGFLLAEEQGSCDGAGLFVYGPSGDAIDQLVEFTTASDCASLSAANIPTGVPKTRMLPDGLACVGESGLTSY